MRIYTQNSVFTAPKQRQRGWQAGRGRDRETDKQAGR